MTVAGNVHRPGQGLNATLLDHQTESFSPEPRYFIEAKEPFSVELALKDVTFTTNSRSIIAAMIPPVAAGHTLPILEIQLSEPLAKAQAQARLLANLNCIPLDFIARTKILSSHASWCVLEQLPVIPSEAMTRRFGDVTASDIIDRAVLELTYTATDIAPFARNIGFVNEDGTTREPFKWDEDRRVHLRAKLDAIFFHLYGLRERDEVRYIYSTFPIVEREEVERWTNFRSRDLCLSYMSALAAGHPDADIEG